MLTVIAGFEIAFRVKIDVIWTPGPPFTNNDEKWTVFLREIFKQEELSVFEQNPSLGGEDFAFYQQKLPGVFVSIGIGENAVLHTSTFTVNKMALPIGAKLYATAAVKALEKLS